MANPQLENGYTPIILTTNLSLSELEAHIEGACTDRLREMCRVNIVKMAGVSYRK
jgi:DNA replication protein DnaC